MWQLKSGQHFRFRQFGDECVLYNDLSGDTHLLGGSAMHLLSMLQQGPHAPDVLLDALAQVLDCAREPIFDDQASAVLAELAALSLIEAA
jgi:PqqD family protein of HPr-rel-A system